MKVKAAAKASRRPSKSAYFTRTSTQNLQRLPRSCPFCALEIYRALINARHVARGDASRYDEALACAKVALIGMDRSLEALAEMATDQRDTRLESMQAQLRRRRREVQARFPSARAFVRPGLDTAT